MPNCVAWAPQDKRLISNTFTASGVLNCLLLAFRQTNQSPDLKCVQSSDVTASMVKQYHYLLRVSPSLLQIETQKFRRWKAMRIMLSCFLGPIRLHLVMVLFFFPERIFNTPDIIAVQLPLLLFPSSFAPLKVLSRQTTWCTNNVFDRAISHRPDLGSFYQVMNTFERLQRLLCSQTPNAAILSALTPLPQNEKDNIWL